MTRLRHATVGRPLWPVAASTKEFRGDRNRPRRCRVFTVGIACIAVQFSTGAVGGETDADASRAGSTPRFAMHGQFTYVEQATDAFRAPYDGPNSLSPHVARETTDATLFIGARLWPGAEGWIAPEIDQGFGLDDTLGAAGFPSGEAYKVGKKEPYLRLPRIFMRQTLELSGEELAIERDSMHLGGGGGANRVVFTVGKFAVTDVFDTNRYAHDARSDFLNWTALDAGTFDYAADAWGYTVGAAAEWYQGPWTLRAGAFDMSHVPNGAQLEPGAHNFQLVAEFENRHEILGRPGRLTLTAFDSRGRMGLLNSAVRLAAVTGGAVDIAAVRRYRSRLGASFGFDQQIAADLGLFGRVGKAAGNVEAYEFTDIDRSVAVGVSLQGARWSRPADTVGIAAMDNAISAARERYLGTGGLGILIGDGRLPHPAAERIIEAYYDFTLNRRINLTLDYQRIQNPAYNTDRGPAQVVGIRLHAQF